mmetsp:Transcript_18569/g.34171  ORF Transcript_18569/g.34171 Transcript_18569/m.34171 type:complete len:376 (-) Transcript_18569:198-1325(-)
MIIRHYLSATRPMLASLLPPYYSLCTPSARTISKNAFKPSPVTLSKLRRSLILSTNQPVVIPKAATTCSQVRFHRTDYEGPGKFGQRETGSIFGEQHHHSHEHDDHTHQEQQQEDHENEKQQLRQLLQARYNRRSGTYSHRGYTVGIGGPVGSGKTALTLALCRALRDKVPMGVVTNDIFTQEDAEFLARNDALDKSKIIPVETGGCPHAAIREDVSANLGALEKLTRRINWEKEENAKNAESGDHDSSASPQREPLLLCESGGDNLAANFSSELADYTIYVIDVAGGDKVPRKGGPGITQSDLLVINKIDLAEAVGADLEVMDRDASRMRKGVQGGKSGPTIFASVKKGVGVDEIIAHMMRGFENANKLVESAR